MRAPGKRNPMTHEELMRRIGLGEYWKLCRKISEEAGAPPHAHAESGEEMKQCPECQEWQRNFEAIWQRVFRPLLKEDRPNPGTLRGTQFVL
jgi:hypothetical protein